VHDDLLKVPPSPRQSEHEPDASVFSSSLCWYFLEGLNKQTMIVQLDANAAPEAQKQKANRSISRSEYQSSNLR